MSPTTFGAMGHILDMRDSNELLSGCGGRRKCYPNFGKTTMTGTTLANDAFAAAQQAPPAAPSQLSLAPRSVVWSA
ncbi:hypothetical protein DIPPA_18107 [Diplonema papillatum]|nr:hypothetical protein DIPPA_18107 [Diplonema papillatum]